MKKIAVAVSIVLLASCKVTQVKTSSDTGWQEVKALYSGTDKTAHYLKINSDNHTAENESYLAIGCFDFGLGVMIKDDSFNAASGTYNVITNFKLKGSMHRIQTDNKNNKPWYFDNNSHALYAAGESSYLNFSTQILNNHILEVSTMLDGNERIKLRYDVRGLQDLIRKQDDDDNYGTFKLELKCSYYDGTINLESKREN